MRLVIRRYRGWLSTLAGVVLLGVAAHWVFHWQVAKRLDQWFQALPESMSGHYESLSTDLRGRVVIDGVHLEGGPLPGPLEVAQVRLRGPSVWRYLADSWVFLGVAPPRFLEFEVAGLSLSLPPAAPEAACEIEQAPALIQLSALGQRELHGRGRGGYAYDPDARRLQGRLDLVFPGVGGLGVQAGLSNVTPESFDQASLGSAALKDMKLDLDVSPVLGMRLIEQCARIEQITPAAYRDRLARAWLRDLEALGVVADSQLREALNRLVADWGRLELTMVPPAPLTLALVPFVPRDQLPQKAGLRLALNGSFLAGIRMAPAPVLENPPHKARQPEKKVVRQALPRPKPSSPRDIRWQRVSPAVLPRYLGRVVRLHEEGRPPRSGLLEAVAQGEALVRQRLRRGEFVAHVPLDRLVRAEVLVGSR